MLKKFNMTITVAAALFAWWIITPTSIIKAEQILNYSSSAQIHAAFKDGDGLDAFEKTTGIKVNTYVTSSQATIYRLMAGLCDLASTTTRELSYEQQDKGCIQIRFCKDPLAVIVNSQNEINDIFDNQLNDIFTGKITNWKQVGGPDQPIIVIIPEKDSSIYQGFNYAVMKGKTIKHDVIMNKSTMVIAAVEKFPAGISFVSHGASINEKGIHVLKINGLEPNNKCYPYFQAFSFVVKGKPEGPAKQFIDFAFSDKGEKIIKSRGMMPLSNEEYLNAMKTCSDVK